MVQRSAHSYSPGGDPRPHVTVATLGGPPPGLLRLRPSRTRVYALISPRRLTSCAADRPLQRAALASGMCTFVRRYNAVHERAHRLWCVRSCTRGGGMRITNARDLGLIVRQARQDRGQTQAALAAAAKVSWMPLLSSPRRASSILTPCSVPTGPSMAEASERRLVVLMAGRRVGVISQGVDGRFSPEYEEQWRLAKDATPLSLSMPLARRTHPDAVV